MGNVLSKKLRNPCCDVNPENIHGDCFECKKHITKSNLTFAEVVMYGEILDHVDKCLHTLCDKCAYKRICQHYLRKYKKNQQKYEHYLQKAADQLRSFKVIVVFS